MSARPRFADLRRLFDEVCDLPPDARLAHLHAAGADAATIAEVEALLVAETRQLRRASSPVEAMLGALPETELDAGDRLGAWRLIQKLASGGMGAVYLAERADGHFQQRAAIKLLRGFPTAAALQHLAAERQILAALQHPHIGRLLDGGATPSGQPYLVMEYVEGVPIDRWCRAADLDLPARLRLFRDVCRAIAFAHQRLIVHCDIKPSNVLVRADGTPVLLDFGIARALDRSRESAGESYFTPGYASPEQMASGPVTVASDVYSLGLILFELASGRKARIDADDRTVTELGSGAVRPSDVADPACRWRGQLRGDIDAIVLRATAEQPALRYPSADALADDIERYLGLQPVKARPPTLWYRYGRLVRRRWPLFAGGALVLALSTVFAWRLVAERDRALAAERAARVHEATARRISEFLVSVFKFADPEQNPDRREITAREVLDEGAKRIGTELADQPRVRAELTGVVARAYAMLGRPMRAIELYREAAATWSDPAVAEPLAAADALSKLAVLQTRQDAAAAERTARQALALREQRLAPDDPDMADSWNTLALALAARGKYEEAEDDFLRALDIRRRKSGAESAGVAAVLHNLGLLYADQERYEAALVNFSHALSLERQLNGSDRHPDTLSTLENYAKVLSRSGRSEEAIPMLRQALQARRALDGGDGEHVASDYNELGAALQDAGRYREALEQYREALRIDARIFGEKSLVYARPLANLASAYADMGDYAAAEPAFREALAIRLAALPAADLVLARAQHDLARVLVARGDVAAAQPLLEAALATRRERLGESHADVLRTLLLYARWARTGGDVAAARSALDAVERRGMHASPALQAARLREQAALDLAGGDANAAVAKLKEALALAVRSDGADHARTAAVALDLASAEARAGHRADAARRVQQCAARIQDAYAPAAPERRLLASLEATLGR